MKPFTLATSMFGTRSSSSWPMLQDGPMLDRFRDALYVMKKWIREMRKQVGEWNCLEVC